MPRKIPVAEKLEALKLIQQNVPQREIARQTGLSRPYLKKLASSIGHKFPRNGYEIVGDMCMCANCGAFLRRPPSKISRCEKQYCDVVCKNMHMRGEENPQWKGGTKSKTFSEWLMNQADYKDWRKQVLERDNYTCQITGLTKDETQLDVHHILPKAEFQDMALEPNNGITLSKEAHDLIHKLIREGHDYQDAVEVAKERIKESN